MGAFLFCSEVNEGTPTRIYDVNCHLICTVCRGYLVDATTITECLHSCESVVTSFGVFIVAYITVKIRFSLSVVRRSARDGMQPMPVVLRPAQYHQAFFTTQVSCLLSIQPCRSLTVGHAQERLHASKYRLQNGTETGPERIGETEEISQRFHLGHRRQQNGRALPAIVLRPQRSNFHVTGIRRSVSDLQSLTFRI